MKTEEFVLDGPPLQSLQQLIQWVGDFVLYLMANLPNQVFFFNESSYQCRPFTELPMKAFHRATNEGLSQSYQ
jgi:hypothetical protein